MRVIISYGARRRWRRRNAYIYNTTHTHTIDTHKLSSAHPHQHACMHACSPAPPSPPHSYETLCICHHPHTAPHNTHYTYTSLLLYTTAHAHTSQHTQPNPNTMQHTPDYVPAACHRDHDETGDHQQTTQTHITPNAIATTTTMTMCDDDHVTMPILPCV